MKEKENIDSRILKNVGTVEKLFTDFNGNAYYLSFGVDEMEHDFPFHMFDEKGERYVSFSINMLLKIERSFNSFLQEFDNVETLYKTEDIDIKKEMLQVENVDVCLTVFISGMEDESYNYGTQRNALRLCLDYREVKRLHEFILLVLVKHKEQVDFKSDSKSENKKEN